MKHNIKRKKVYLVNNNNKYESPKVIEFAKVKPYFRKVKFKETKKEKKTKVGIITSLVVFLVFLYLGLLFLGRRNDSKDLVEVDTNIEQVVNNREEAKNILGFEVIDIRNIPKNFTQNYMEADPINNIYKVHYIIEEKNNNQKKNILLIQKKTPTKSIRGTVDGFDAEYSTFNNENDDFSTYMDLSNTESSDNTNINNINMIQWYDGDYEFSLIGDVGVEGLLKFVSENLGKEVSFLFKP